MKKVIHPLFILSIFSFSLTLNAQPSLWIEKVDSSADSLKVGVKTEGFTDVGAFQFSLNWDPALLEYAGLQSLNSTLQLSEKENFNTDIASNGQLGLLWYDSGGEGKSLPAESVIFELKFVILEQVASANDIRFSNDPVSIAFGSTTGPVDPLFPVKFTAAITGNSCFGDSAGAIDLSVTGGSGQFVINWENGAESNRLADLPAGSYAVTITDTVNAVMLDTLFVVDQPPELMAVTDSLPDTGGEGVGQAWVTPSGGTPPYRYSWSTTPEQTDSVATGLTAGAYSVTITDVNGCELVKEVIVKMSTRRSLLQWPLVQTFQRYPNPAVDWLRIEVEFLEVQDFKIEIINPVGKVIATAEFTDTKRAQLQPDLTRLAPGLYFLRLQNSKGYLTRRFVKK